MSPRLGVLAALVGCAVACAAERARPDSEPTTGIHPAGIGDVTSADFHGRELARRGSDLALCATCHGADFSGGAAQVSCNECHAGGPGACATCHGDGPTSGAHDVHRIDGALACAECHVVPATWDAEGHVRRDGRVDAAPAEITFGARAAVTLAAADRAGPPAYVDGGCSNVYCHGDVLRAGGGLDPRPRWDAVIVGGCDRCHGAPPPSHAAAECASCHPASAPHVDGVVQIGRTAGCDGCHGRAGDPAPPTDLAGNEFTTALGVGAHQAHLVGPSFLRGPIACATCHLVPASTNAPGHIDSALPAEVTASLGWERATATCGTAWCHGPALPVWTLADQDSCGSCHGVPPSTPSHTPGMPLASCTTCHPRSIDAAGNFLFTSGPTGPVSEHIDGDVDLQ
ncbi:MAG: CxxxxCH/CxxCH domain-containing protein [Myxococcota bacterium]|nr:CxxxxCH/CxxCH domain-containing protein [Myxococcota bacterium]